MKYLALFGRLTLVVGCLAVVVYLAIYNATSSRLQQLTAKEDASNLKGNIHPSPEEIIASTLYDNVTTTARSTPLRSLARSRGQSSALIPTKNSFRELRRRNVFYNRIGKCGSRSLFQIIQSIAQYNHFRVAYSTDYGHEHPPFHEAIAEMVKISRLKPPTLYNRHIHFLDFEKHRMKSPIYINMIRDPIARFSSHYNYLKYGDQMGNASRPETGWEDINECVMKDSPKCLNEKMTFYMGFYFCGFEDSCKNHSDKRVEIAKKHIDEYYYVIGMLEEFENTLLLLEKMLPDFFRGAAKVWKRFHGMRDKTKTLRKDILTEDSKKKLKMEHLADEYEVYEHAKNKFERLKKEHGIS